MARAEPVVSYFNYTCVFPREVKGGQRLTELAHAGGLQKALTCGCSQLVAGAVICLRNSGTGTKPGDYCKVLLAGDTPYIPAGTLDAGMEPYYKRGRDGSGSIQVYKVPGSMPGHQIQAVKMVEEAELEI